MEYLYHSFQGIGNIKEKDIEDVKRWREGKDMWYKTVSSWNNTTNVIMNRRAMTTYERAAANTETW